MSSLRDFDPAPPHGPNMTEEHVASRDIHSQLEMTPLEIGVFNEILLPPDNYDEKGNYWADMNIFRRIQFVNKVDREEASREWRSTWEMIKLDPLSPVGWYFRNMVIPGLGLGLEGYA